MRRGQKISILLVLAAAFFMLSGFELFPDVELSYKKPLIDLYGNSSEENPFNYTEEANTYEVKPEVTEQKPVAERYIVGVKNKTVTLDGRECSADELIETLGRKASPKSEVLLWDNYAEYYTYSAVREKLAELKEKKRFSLVEKALGEVP
ncbi:MAG: hypothetical protein K5668_09660 [Lachnospiraceae bacterium]|nr:hypothetical protein [Lachnospiraceae bacterium]